MTTFSLSMMFFFLLVVLPIVVIVVAIVALLFRMLMGGIGSKDRGKQNDEARLIQEIHQGLGRMEQRIESLETIVADTDAKKKEEASRP